MLKSKRAAILALGAVCLFMPPLGTAEAQTATKTKKPSLAECATLLDPFKNKQSSAVKDEAITEYAPLIKIYWQKHCPKDFYEQQVSDADLRKRIEAAAPPPKGAAKKS
jgi:hypothetical protein